MSIKRHSKCDVALYKMEKIIHLKYKIKKTDKVKGKDWVRLAENNTQCWTNYKVFNGTKIIVGLKNVTCKKCIKK